MSEARTAPRGMNGFQAGADRLGARRGPGGFHSRATFGEGRWMDQVVPRAVTRAQEGDREALRFL
jgi:hypothetical protein